MSNQKNDLVPDFICIGSQRCGTGWVYKNLCSHDQIYLPPIKELHYFDELDSERRSVSLYQKSKSRYQKKHLKTVLQNIAKILLQRENRNFHLDIDFWKNYYLGNGSLEWYKSLFLKAKKSGKIVGEITPAYSILPDPAIQKIKSINPNLKLIYLIRNPIERSFSQAIRYFIKNAGRSISEVSQLELIDFIKSDICTSRSDYLTSLQNYKKYFDTDDILICFFDEIKSNPASLLDKICNFIDVPPLKYSNIRQEAVGNLSHLRGGMSEDIRLLLETMYGPQIEEMSHQLGGYCETWYKQLLVNSSKAS